MNLTIKEVRRLSPRERPPPIPHIPGRRNWGGGCEHLHDGRPSHPCGNSAGFEWNGKKLCWSHLSMYTWGYV